MARKNGQPAASSEQSQNRVHLRLDAKSKRKLERAAAYQETTISRFVAANALAAAERVIKDYERVVLSATGWDAFHDALICPPEPNPKIKAAVRRHRHAGG